MDRGGGRLTKGLHFGHFANSRDGISPQITLITQTLASRRFCFDNYITYLTSLSFTDFYLTIQDILFIYLIIFFILYFLLILHLLSY